MESLAIQGTDCDFLGGPIRDEFVVNTGSVVVPESADIDGQALITVPESRVSAGSIVPTHRENRGAVEPSVGESFEGQSGVLIVVNKTVGKRDTVSRDIVGVSPKAGGNIEGKTSCYRRAPSNDSGEIDTIDSRIGGVISEVKGMGVIESAHEPRSGISVPGRSSELWSGGCNGEIIEKKGIIRCRGITQSQRSSRGGRFKIHADILVCVRSTYRSDVISHQRLPIDRESHSRHLVAAGIHAEGQIVSLSRSQISDPGIAGQSSSAVVGLNKPNLGSFRNDSIIGERASSSRIEPGVGVVA